MIAVAHVVLNRIKSSKFPETICEVVKQKIAGVCQFSWVCVKIKTRDMPHEVYDIAVMTLNGETTDPTKGALFFHHKSVDAFKRTQTAVIGNHVFYK